MKNDVRKPRSIVEVYYLEKKYQEEKDVRVRERILVALLYFDGYDPPDIANIIRKTTKTVSMWIRRYKKRYNIKALRDNPRSGRLCNLTKDKEKELEEIILNKTPSEFGYDNIVWDMKVVKDFVENRYKVVFSFSGMWRMVRQRLGFSYGKSYQKDTRQDLTKVKEFLEKTLQEVAERIRNLVKKGKRVLVGLEDESYHQIKPNVQRALFKGKSIKVKTINLPGEKATAFGFLSLSGDLFLEYYDTGNANNFINFCKSLEEKEYDHIVIFLDNSKYHGNAKYRGSKKVRQYWKESKIEPVFMPPYSPELNSIEQVWRVIKKYLSKYFFRKIDNVVDKVFEFVEQKEHPFLSIVSKFANEHFSKITLT